MNTTTAHRSYRLHRSGVALANELPFLTRPSFVDVAYRRTSPAQAVLSDVVDTLDVINAPSWCDDAYPGFHGNGRQIACSRHAGHNGNHSDLYRDEYVSWTDDLI